MSALILKRFNHFSKILKVYLTLSIVGAVAVIAFELARIYPMVTLVVGLCVGALVSKALLTARKYLLINRVLDEIQAGMKRKLTSKEKARH